MRRLNPDPWRYVFHGDKWKVPGSTDWYEFEVSRVPRAGDVMVSLKLMKRTGCRRVECGGWPSHVAPYFKQVARRDGLKPVRRPAKERLGKPHFELWW